MFPRDQNIGSFDPEIASAIDAERLRQEQHLELIASENYTSPRVLKAQGSVLTNKYAEGYPGKRYYGGCENVDIVEQLAIDRARKLFGAAYANVQPHSGSQANAAVYLALLAPGETLLGMSLDHGGHLTHGAKVNFSGKLFHAVQYGLDPATGAVVGEGDIEANRGRRTITLTVANTGDRPIQVGSHFHFFEANRALRFERARAFGVHAESVDGMDPGTLTGKLFEQYRILVTPIKHADFSGIRITPNIYSTMEEMDRFCTAVEKVVRNA